MFKYVMALLLVTFTSTSFALCHNSSMEYGAPISVDLSDKLSAATPEWTGSFSTQYNGSFNCSTGNSQFGYTAVITSSDEYATILSFQNGKYNVRAEITNEVPNKTLANWGGHIAAELNVPMTVRFSLVQQSGTNVPGNSATLDDTLFVTDLSGMSIMDIINWPFQQFLKFVTWLLNGFHWPYDSRDMFGQPMIIKYAPKSTTCSFSNAGLTVTLPTVGRNQILNDSRPGFTPFNLNMQCEGQAVGGTTDRAIDMFLSSTSLLAADPTVMTDSSAGAAQGVGLRLVKREAEDSPVVLSTSSTSKGNATSLYYVAAGGALGQQLSIPMGVYYYSWSPENLSQGTVNTTATLNIIYP
ncbi:MAG TPA: fimbrial protein [Buttiauxella sp.]|jgi:type 1 fimbria pilin